MRQWWRHISDPSLWPNERLFFELYGQALQGRPGDGRAARRDRRRVDRAGRRGLRRRTGWRARRRSRRRGWAIAVSRGLLLDLLATEDREAVDAAMEAYIDLMERKLGAVLQDPD